MSRCLVSRVSTCASRAGTIAAAAAFTVAVTACGANAPTAPVASNMATPSSSSGASGGTTPPAIGQNVNGAIVLDAGNPTCADLAATYAPGATWYEVKLDRAPKASESLGDGVISLALANGTTRGFDWSASRSVDALLVKSGSMGNNFYLYTPEASSGSGTTPGSLQDISHITFCYDVELQVSETAATTFTRDYDWTIAASVDQPSVTLEQGGQASVNYSTTATKDVGTDSDWAIAGTISVTNPHPFNPASGITVADSLSDHGAIEVICPATSLAPMASMTCNYAAVALATGSPRTNTATARSTTYGIAEGVDATPIAFTTPTTVLDNAVTVADTYAGAGTLGSGITGSRNFSYSRTILASDLVCGANAITSTVSLATDDGSTETANVTVNATLTCATATPLPVPPPPPPPPAPVVGCAYSQGYWSTHSSNGPAKYDSTWAKLGENTPFYKSGNSYIAEINVPAKGNAYHILSSQFIAARLNMLAGAAAPAGVDMSAIESFFALYTPAQIDALKGNDSVRRQALEWASTLDGYNNGRLNVAHCG